MKLTCAELRLELRRNENFDPTLKHEYCFGGVRSTVDSLNLPRRKLLERWNSTRRKIANWELKKCQTKRGGALHHVYLLNELRDKLDKAEACAKAYLKDEGFKGTLEELVEEREQLVTKAETALATLADLT
jgi:hypothetical protein